jgi:hypothetical protein
MSGTVTFEHQSSYLIRLDVLHIQNLCACACAIAGNYIDIGSDIKPTVYVVLTTDGIAA